MGEPSERTDGELVAAALDGCGEAFPLLVQRYRPALLRVAVSRLGDVQQGEDVVQEAFLNAHRWLATYNSQYSFRTWLWTILLNQCRRTLTRRSRGPRTEGWSGDDDSTAGTAGGFAEPVCPEPSPPSVLLAKERAELLERALHAIPEDEADALRLRFFGELRFQEIADAVGCSENTAQNRVRRGLMRLARLVTAAEARIEAVERDIENGETRSGL